MAWGNFKKNRFQAIYKKIQYYSHMDKNIGIELQCERRLWEATVAAHQSGKVIRVVSKLSGVHNATKRDYGRVKNIQGNYTASSAQDQSTKATSQTLHVSVSMLNDNVHDCSARTSMACLEGLQENKMAAWLRLTKLHLGMGTENRFLLKTGSQWLDCLE